MYNSRFDVETQIFHATLSESVEMAELAKSLQECFATEFEREMKALWQIGSMQVAFGLAEVEQLLQMFKVGEIDGGKFAFVVGDQQFLRGVVESVRTLRDDWSTVWRVFDSAKDALDWLSS